MSKRRRRWSEQTYRRYLREGRGQGTLSSYKPWITIRDIASYGRASRVYGMTTGRVHHFLSSHELRYFYLLDWSEKALDIREQYPLLDLDAAMGIAEKAGIRYPFDGISGFPYVLTSDFLITTPSGDVARAVKPKRDLENPRVREKLEIERRYWTAKGVDWKIVTEDEINRQKSMNIEWLFQSPRPEELIADETRRNYSLRYFEALYKNSVHSVAKLARMVEDELSLEAGTGVSLFKSLVLSRRIEVSLDAPLNMYDSRATEEMGCPYGVCLQEPDFSQ